MELQTHQRNTVQYLENRCINQHGVLVFHNMGTGKTGTAIGWLLNRKKLYDNNSKHTHKQDTENRAQHASPVGAIEHRSTKKQNKKNKKKTQIRKDNKKPSKRIHQRAGSTPYAEEASEIEDISNSSEFSSESSTASRQRSKSHKHIPVAKRKFDYVIVCPETIKGEWDKESQKMGFELDGVKLLNYKRVHGLVQSQEFDVSGKNVVFDEAHHLCTIMKTENMEYYTYVLKQLSKADKLLLLTGTPEYGGKADFMILVNIVAKRNKFPVHTKELYEKYRKRDTFEKQKKSIFFNWVKPVAWRAFKWIYYIVATIITREIGKYTRNVLYPGYFHKKVKGLVNLTKKAGGGGGEENVDIQMGGDGFWNTGQAFINNATGTMKQNLSDAIKTVPTNSTQASQLMKDLVDREMENFERTGKQTTIILAKEIDRGIQSIPSMMMMWALQKYVMSSFRFLQVEHDPLKALKKAPLDLQQMSKDIGRYVSYYQQDSESVDFGSTKIEKPTEALYTTYQSQQCLFFIYGTMNERMVRFYANVNRDGAKLKIQEFRTLYGVEKYGRCISNMWNIVDYILNKQVKFIFDDNDGTVRLKFRHRKNKKASKKNHKNDVHKEKINAALKKMEGCPKFHNVVRLLKQAQQRGERTLIRSDFKKQGIYLLSAYLNSLNIKHYYIRSKMSKDERNRILDEYNDVYRPILVDNKKARLLENVEEHQPLDSIHQMFVGVSVRSKTNDKRWTQGRVHQVYMQNELIDIIDDDSGEIIKELPISDIYRVFHIAYDKNNKRVQVKSESIEFIPYDRTRQPSIILLDKDSSEGISLMGIEHVHLLEPLESVAERDQSLARAIRFQSHRHLPKSRHTVHVYTHVGVVKPSDTSMDSVTAIMKERFFEFERSSHINKQFAGVIPRAAKGDMKSDPIGYMFDQYWNGIPLLHDGFDGTSSTPDTMVLENVSAEETHIGEYTEYIKRTNVIGKNFDLPKDCVENTELKLQIDGFMPVHNN